MHKKILKQISKDLDDMKKHGDMIDYERSEEYLRTVANVIHTKAPRKHKLFRM